MIRYVIETNNKLDFTNPLDVENPFAFDLKLLKPSTNIYLVDYTKSNNKIIINYSLNKSCLLVVKSIVNLYPNLIFSLDIDFWKEDTCRSTLLKTCLRTLTKRCELSHNGDHNVEKFKTEYVKFLTNNKLGDKNEIELVRK